MLCSLSQLAANDLDQITHLERQIGHTLLAFSCHTSDPAALTAEQLDKVKALEAHLGISLVAVEVPEPDEGRAWV